MFKVGITGGIGSGKTTVCRIFEMLGIPVFYADIHARALMHTDTRLKDEMVAAFGPLSYLASGELNRKYIASQVFRDPGELARLNSIVHPAVFRAFGEWIALKNDVPYVIKEAALLIESGSAKLCDRTILVKAPEELKIKRVMERDHIGGDEVTARMKNQLSDREKEKLADFIIYNNEELLIIPQVLRLHESFLSVRPGNGRS